MKKRFIKSVIASAESNEVDMPWTRGKRRQEFIAKRAKEAVTNRKYA